MTSARGLFPQWLARLCCRLVRRLPGRALLLGIALDAGHVQWVSRLLRAGIDPDTPVHGGRSPLRIAVERGNTALMAVLLNGGAAPDARPHPERHSLLLEAARFAGDRGVRLLLDAGAQVDARNFEATTQSGFPTLAWAAFVGQTETVRVLLWGGADPDRADGHPEPETNGYASHWRPLALAAQGGHQGTVDALIAGGADEAGLDLSGAPRLALTPARTSAAA